MNYMMTHQLGIPDVPPRVTARDPTFGGTLRFGRSVPPKMPDRCTENLLSDVSD